MFDLRPTSLTYNEVIAEKAYDKQKKGQKGKKERKKDKEEKRNKKETILRFDLERLWILGILQQMLSIAIALAALKNT